MKLNILNNIIKVLLIMPLSIQTIVSSEHEQILKWWKKMSEQKPIRCKIDASYLEPLHPIAGNLTNSWEFIKIIDSRPCTEKDSGKRYLVHEFRGVKVNSRFEGKYVDI